MLYLKGLSTSVVWLTASSNPIFWSIPHVFSFRCLQAAQQHDQRHGYVRLGEGQKAASHALREAVFGFPFFLLPKHFPEAEVLEFGNRTEYAGACEHVRCRQTDA